MPNESQNKGTTVAENSGTGVETSKAQRSTASSSNAAGYAELELALIESQKANQALLARVNQLEKANSSDSSINKLTEALTNLVKQNQAPVQAHGPTESDNINRTDHFNAKASVDGRSLVEAQRTLQMFRNEAKKPISIPKSMAAKFGPTLPINVNGVRVSIPCDGKTYFINETHWEHARERIAKVDALDAGMDNNIVEIG